MTSALVWNFKGDFRIYKGKSAWHIKRKAKINLRSLNFHVCSGYKLNVKAEKSGLVSSLGGSPGPFQVTGRGGTLGRGVSHHRGGAQREHSWWRLARTSSLWSYEQLGSPLFSNATPCSSLGSPLLIHLASSLPTENSVEAVDGRRPPSFPVPRPYSSVSKGDLSLAEAYIQSLDIQACAHRDAGSREDPRKTQARALTPVGYRSGDLWVKIPLDPSPVIIATARQQERGSLLSPPLPRRK